MTGAVMTTLTLPGSDELAWQDANDEGFGVWGGTSEREVSSPEIGALVSSAAAAAGDEVRL